jgi:drug/metabolite transporter (DMT)-like permease
MRRHPHSAAIVLMLLAVLLFALMDAGLKLLSAKYPPLQVAALRGLSSLPFVLAWALLTVPPGSLLRIHWPLHLLRGALGVAMMAGFVYGLRGMPLSTAYAITFVAPLLVTAMAGPLLRERVGLGRWLAIAVGLLGVLVILRPTGEGMMTAGGLAVLVAAICYAAGAITVRLLAQRDSTQSMVVWFMALLSVAALVVLSMLVVLCAIAFGLLVASFGWTEKQIGSTVPVILLVMGLIGGCMFPRLLMPPFMQKLGQIVPHSWALDGYYAVLVREGTSIADIAPSLAALSAFAVGFAGLGLWRFKFE